MAGEVEVVVNPEEGESATPAAPVEVLAEVAREAIGATADRVEELALARAEIGQVNTRLEALTLALAEHAQSNDADFVALREEMRLMQEELSLLISALRAMEVEEEEEQEEEEQEEKIETAEALAAAASVEAAEALESPAPEAPATVEVETPTHGGHSRRHFVRIGGN